MGAHAWLHFASLDVFVDKVQESLSTSICPYCNWMHHYGIKSHHTGSQCLISQNIFLILETTVVHCFFSLMSRLNWEPAKDTKTHLQPQYIWIQQLTSTFMTKRIPSKLSSVPFLRWQGLLSWCFPPPGSPVLCWACPAPYPSFHPPSAGGSLPRSGRRSCPESLVLGRMWRWGRTGGVLRRWGRRMARKGSEEGCNQVTQMRRRSRT